MTDSQTISQASGLHGGLSIIAHPLANEKLTLRTLKLVRKASKQKAIRRGVKEIAKAFRKNETGLLVLAGNVSPIDVISHLPVLAEEHGIPYIYVPEKEELGAASSTKRPTSCVLVLKTKDEDYMESYNKVYSAVSEVQVVTE